MSRIAQIAASQPDDLETADSLNLIRAALEIVREWSNSDDVKGNEGVTLAMIEQEIFETTQAAIELAEEMEDELAQTGESFTDFQLD